MIFDSSQNTSICGTEWVDAVIIVNNEVSKVGAVFDLAVTGLIQISILIDKIKIGLVVVWIVTGGGIE